MGGAYSVEYKTGADAAAASECAKLNLDLYVKTWRIDSAGSAPDNIQLFQRNELLTETATGVPGPLAAASAVAAPAGGSQTCALRCPRGFRWAWD